MSRPAAPGEIVLAVLATIDDDVVAKAHALLGFPHVARLVIDLHTSAVVGAAGTAALHDLMQHAGSLGKTVALARSGCCRHCGSADPHVPS